ncbi:basic blue protein-like [Andrographis paniculata]|uniref:basic blue protein-like n=1 Tax=Andrographis paniculata TaxID=175694 RepID=UPI0021E84AEF|nr:basic blue protein-like [Andrographis paniculata]
MKGEAVVVTVVVMLGFAQAAVYNVGDAKGWGFNVLGWEHGKNFRAGDTLVFKYDTTLHSVVRVDKASFDACSIPPNAPKYATGNDQIVLPKGPNYFLCGTPGHCTAGVRITAFAA